MRKFQPFDATTIMKEMRSLPSEDFAALKWAMEQYQNSTDQILPPAMIESQGSYAPRYREIFKIRHRSGRYAGRAFFYFGQELNGSKPIYVLLVYKKETDEAPRNLLDAAYERMLVHSGRK